MKLQNYIPLDVKRQQLLQQSIDIVDNIKNWELVKSTDDTKILKTTFNDDFWCGRISPHLSSEYSNKLKELIIGQPIIGKTHSDYESDYMNEVKSIKVENLQSYDFGYSYQLKAIYDLGFPLKHRVFHVLIHIWNFGNYGIVTSLPISGNNDEGNVIAKYISVEKVKINDDGSIEWIMATSSNPSGWIPQFITRAGMPGAIQKDVPSLLKYIDAHP
ncbi:unnamed protein product [Candida verbasci]|uniref:DUF3074 domain-containing protein n=1 Tax=Candida verbasci TaxID=1227364 RepID=A0A9W4U2E2_9ASCO|nr:unnamed protein product [Candida verbasci]